MKKDTILGAFNFLVLRLAYEYPLRGYFEESGEKGLSYMHAFDSFKEKRGGFLKNLPSNVLRILIKQMILGIES